MSKIIESFSGNTKGMISLRNDIAIALKEGPVKVHLWQPGIMYEMHDPSPNWYNVVDFINEWKGKPVSFYSNMVPLKKVFVEYNYVNDMFFEGNKLYEENDFCKNLLAKLFPIAPNRRYKWDILFGRKNNVKEYLFKKFLDHPVKPHALFTYYGEHIKNGLWSQHVVRPDINSAEFLNTYKRKSQGKIRCSDLIDPDIYNQTYYSAVIETVIHNDFAMFSEKEAKPIIAKRPFVIFGSRHHLKAFRSLGFKTFDTIIDESYDNIEDMEERFLAVLNAMYDLSLRDPLKIYETVKDVLAHNKKHFLEHRWTSI